MKAARTNVAGCDASADLQLAFRAGCGDPEAVTELGGRLGVVERFIRSLNSRHSRVLDFDDVEDLVQDVVLEILGKLKSFRGKAGLETWLYAICRTRFLNRVRDIDRRRCRRVEGLDLNLEAQGRARAGGGSELSKYLQALADRDQAIISLKHEGDLTFEQIGGRLKMSSSSVKTRYYRCLGAVRRRLNW